MLLLSLEKCFVAKDGSDLLLVPGGFFEMGDVEDDNCSRHRVWVDSYYLRKILRNKHEVREIRTGDGAPASGQCLLEGRGKV